MKNKQEMAFKLYKFTIRFITVVFCIVLIWMTTPGGQAQLTNAAVDNSSKSISSVGTSIALSETSAKSLLNQADCHSWDDEEIMDYFEEVTPSLEYTCPYDIHKCVYSMQFNRHELTVTWDIYLFSYDGIIGTWIVNDSGKDIVFYGDAYLYSIDNYNVHLGKYFRTEFDTSVTLKHLCVSPESFTDGFMVVTYYEEIAKIPD